LRRRDTSSLIITGITLGLAQLSKFTALLLYPIFILIIVIIACRRTTQNGNNASDNQYNLSYFLHIFLIFIVSLLVINGGYLLSGSFIPISDYHFTSAPLKFISSLFWKSLPVPLPYEYLMGFDTQLALSGGNYYSTYLMGEHSMNGWWYYYIIAFIVKSPISLLLVLIISIVYYIKNRSKRPEDLLCLWIPVVAFFFYFSFLTHIPIGIRFLLKIKL
jgi:4-amino-4-deoxy-L-arabinose transferase-like glycosyltransferase